MSKAKTTSIVDAAVVTEAKAFGAVKITDTNHEVVQKYIDEGTLVEPSIMGLVGKWAIQPDYEESAYVLECRVRPDHVKALPDWYSQDEQQWFGCDFFGNPADEASLRLQDVLFNGQSMDLDDEWEVRVRRVGTAKTFIVVAGRPPESEE